MNCSRTFTAGLGVCVLLGMLDIAGLAGINTPGAPPVAVVVTGGTLGLITLVGALLAWRQVPGSLSAVVVARVLSALLGVPVFFVDAPALARAVVAIALVLTVVGIWLLFPALRRPQTHGARR